MLKVYILNLIILVYVSVKPTHNSHTVNTNIDEHVNKLTTHNNYVNNLTETGNAIQNSINSHSNHHVKLKELQDKLQQTKSETDNDQFKILVNEYNTMVSNYNKNKHLYCPNLVHLTHKPETAWDPKFNCEHVSHNCSRYAAYTFMLQKIFNSPLYNTNNSSDILNNHANCLINHIYTYILNETTLATTPLKDHSSSVKQFNYQAKCCKLAIEKFVIDNYTGIKNTSNSSLLIGNLKFPENYFETTAEAKTQLENAIAQIRSSLTKTTSIV